MTEIRSLRIDELVDAVAAETPAPGGGAVAAIVTRLAAALTAMAGRYGVGVPSVEVDFPAVIQRVRGIIDSQSVEGPKPFEEQGIRVFLQEARLIGPHEIDP